ncbi:MAG: hypothetical protein EOO73_22010 [Myxococcales bacterium]|nr:MAG: hypothetical protein EOO73_22010 [Myxococcales bacterium]
MSDDTLGKDLTDAQFEALCERAAKEAEDVLGEDAKKATCGFAALFATTLSGAMGEEADALCKMTYDECLAEPEEPSENECTKPTESCTATVGEIETCFSDTIAQAKAGLADLPSCDDLGTEFEVPTDNETPASCEIVQEKCPEALE